ncbi:hypothetical protein Hdeb2414_s0001g00018581 [Helianthus debilis subsp. tardiflorus]
MIKGVLDCSEFRDVDMVIETVRRILEGEMLRVTLSNPRNSNAQHLRVVLVVPLRSGFRPMMDSLSELYGVRSDR